MAKIAASYTGRTVDLLVMERAGADTQTPSGPVELVWGGPSKITAGVQKAAQQWLMAFLTRKGSNLNNPDYGTGFMDALTTGLAQDGQGLMAAFATASDAVLRFFSRADRGTTLPDDEVITRAELLSFDFPSPDQLKLTVGLTTRAGTTYQYLTPIVAVPA